MANQKLAPTPGQPDALHYIGGNTKPSAEVSLRTIDPDRFVIINTATGETLEEIEASSAFFEVYDGAVYMHHGRPFLCTKLDISGRVAHVMPSTVRYYTSVVNHRHVHVVGGGVAYNAASNKPFEATSARVGQALISLRYSAYVRTARGSQITFGAYCQGVVCAFTAVHTPGTSMQVLLSQSFLRF
jgi:DEAD/DEAH box helicase domain-containing protein